MKLLERIDIKNLTTIDVVRYKFASKYVKNKKVLDIACGSGYGTMMLSRAGAHKVTGIDIDQNTILDLKKQYSSISNFEFISGSVYEIPFPDEHFDVLVSMETLEHLAYPDIFLKEAKRVLKKSGKIILSTPLNEGQDRLTPQNPYHVREYNFSEIKNMMNKYFFNLEFHFQHSILKANWLTRIFDKLRKYGINLEPIKARVNPRLVIIIRKIMNAQKNKIISSVISKENYEAEVVIVIGNK